MPLQPRGKRHGLLPPRCPDSASWAMTEPEKRPDDMILMQLDGVGGIAVIAYQIACAGIATGKVGQQGCIHFHPVGSTPATAHQIRCHRRDNQHIRAAMSCRPAPEGWEWWAFSYIKSCRSPASLCHAGLHFQLCNIFFQVRHGSGRKLHPSSVFLYCCHPFTWLIRSCSAARAAASSSCRVIHPLRIRHGRNLPVFSCWLLHHPLPAGSPAAH